MQTHDAGTQVRYPWLDCIECTYFYARHSSRQQHVLQFLLAIVTIIVNVVTTLVPVKVRRMNFSMYFLLLFFFFSLFIYFFLSHPPWIPFVYRLLSCFCESWWHFMFIFRNVICLFLFNSAYAYYHICIFLSLFELNAFCLHGKKMLYLRFSFVASSFRLYSHFVCNGVGK